MAALGGNALLRRGEAPDADIQHTHVMAAVEALAPLARDHDLVITHGNGPQVGLLALESAQDPALARPYPFDVLGAETQGMIGYWLLQALENALPGQPLISILTQTLVAADDPAFGNPTKFIGPVYDETQARLLERQWGWDVRRDGQDWRRVVPSPEPQMVLEIPMIRTLLADGATVICAGGGGIPVVRGVDGALEGVEAVVDKDLTAALLGRVLGADALLLLTDVPAVERDFATPTARAIGHITVDALRRQQFPAGSMGPKVEAACRFVEWTANMAAIGKLEDAVALVAKTKGTIVEASPSHHRHPVSPGTHGANR